MLQCTFRYRVSDMCFSHTISTKSNIGKRYIESYIALWADIDSKKLPERVVFLRYIVYFFDVKKIGKMDVKST